MGLLYTHAGFMCIGFLFLLTGFIIVCFMKRKSWWLKIHRLCGILGGSCAVLGLCAVTLDIVLAGGQHFRIPHSYIGAVVVILVAAAPFLGFMQFRSRQHVKAIKGLHIWSGRIALLLMFINIVLGISI